MSASSASGSKGEPTERSKKQRKARGQQSKCQSGDQATTKEIVRTDVMPGEYMEMIDNYDLKESEKLPAKVLP